MNFVIIWSEFAESQLDEIYEYYKTNVSLSVAKKLINDIINEPNKLINTPHIGQLEDGLIKRKTEYRYLVFQNYKMIYSVDKNRRLIKIADVFDTRQNPPKLQRNK